MQLHKLLDSNLQICVAATGAGAGIQNELWKVPGASSFLAGAYFPYDKRLTEEFLGFTPEKFCSPETALDLAMEAYRRAIDLNNTHKRPVGLGLTASVASLVEHRGDHRVHVACMTEDKVIAADLVLPKGVGKNQRLWDGSECDEFGLQTMMLTLLFEEHILPRRSAVKEATERFFERPGFVGHRRVKAHTLTASGSALFPGAFNPPHRGHYDILERIEALTDCTLSVCSTSPHKPALSVQQMLRHSKQFEGSFTKPVRVLYTREDPFYIDKARNHPNCRLVLGADALERMLDPKWGTDLSEMFAEFEWLGTTFMVFGRPISEDHYLDAESVIAKVPDRHRSRFTAPPVRTPHLFYRTTR